MKLPWTLVAVMATGSLMVTTPNSPSCATPAIDRNVRTEGIIKDRFSKIELPFDVQPTELVFDRIRMYITGGRRDTERILGRSVLYYPIYEHYLRQYNLPSELKYLPMIESGFRPTVRSSVGAVGMWQLMAPTARHYGLQINGYLDERRDPYRSTEAAVRLLADLHDMFGDWALVLAAYNGGLGRVKRAIEYAGCNDYTAVKRFLPKETQRYVPYFMAAVYIAKHYNAHGLYPKFPDYRLQNTRVLEVHPYVTFREIAKATGLDYGTISTLNPGFLSGAVPNTEDGCYLVLPADAIAGAKKLLKGKAGSDWAKNVPSDGFRYSHTIEAGDSLEKLAKTFKCSVEDIMKWNNLAKPKVVINQEIDLYLSKAMAFNRA